MKRFYFICTVALLTAVACNKDMPADVQGDGSVTLKAVVETDTKVNASINKDTRKVNFTWTAQDVIAVETSDGFENFTLAGQGGSADGSFTGNPSGEIGDVAVFPSILSPELDGTSLTVTLPAEYNGVNLQTNALLLGSHVGGNICFQHIGSLLLCSYGNVSSATKFVVSVPGKKINGAYTLDLSQDTPYIALEDTDVEAESKVAVKVAGNQNIVVFVPLPVGEYPQMSVWLENAAGEIIPGSLKTTTTTKTLSRKTVKEMPGVHVYNSYVIASAAEAASFAPSDRVVQNLTILGAEIGDHETGLIAAQIDVVKGDVVIDGATFTTTEHLFPNIVCEGSIVLKNITVYDQNVFATQGTKILNLNGFKNYAEIKGDLIFENIPYMAHWGTGNSLAQIKKVGGDLIVRECCMTNVAFMSLEEVGGDFILDNNSLNLEPTQGAFWNLVPTIIKVGGDFKLTDNAYVNSLAGYEKIESIGGNVLIKGNGTKSGGIPLQGSTALPGFELVQGWITNGIISKDKVTCTNHQGTPVDFN